MATKTAVRKTAQRANGAGGIDSATMLRVLAAVQRGDFSARMPAGSSSYARKVAAALNAVIESNQGLERQIRRLSRSIGKEGQVKHAASSHAGGAWASTLDAVNDLVEDLSQPNTEIARVISAVANGDLSQTMALEIEGRPLQGQFLTTAKTVNTMVGQLNAFASEVTRVAREVGTEGNLGGQAEVKGVGGIWKDLTDNVNLMAGNLTSQVRNIAEVTTGIANGDLSKKITVDVRGEILELKQTINTMVDQLNAFAKEVTRVAREVGTEGKLGGQADVKGVAGIWKDLTDNVNTMASNLTNQVRGIAEVTTAVQQGDLSKKITVDVRGEILELKQTINTMVDQLNAFANEVTRVAREVGTEGSLGGQADVEGVAGTWKDLTDNVNTMASNLTDQVRGIARVVTAVANGNLKGKLTLEAKGEIAELADTINSMTDTLAVFAEQVTTVAREVGAEGRLGGQAHVPGAAGTWRDLTTVSKMILSELAPLVHAEHGVLYGIVPTNGRPTYLALQAGYAYRPRKDVPMEFTLGEGLIGQCALEKKRIVITEVPKDYIKISSALGESTPANIGVLPVPLEGGVRAVIERASLQPSSLPHLHCPEPLAPVLHS